MARATREGWTREIQNAKALAKREDAPLTVTPVQAVACPYGSGDSATLNAWQLVSERGVDHIETMNGPEILDSVDEIEKLDKVARRTFGLHDGDAHGNNVMVNVAILGVDPESVSVDQRDV